MSHQGQLTPLQRFVIQEGAEYRKEQAQKDQPAASTPRRKNAAATSKEDIMRKNISEKYGEDSGRVKSEDAGPDKPLVMDEDEVL